MHRILRRSIVSACLGFRLWARHFAFFPQILPVAENQPIDALAEVCEEFIARDIHGAQDRTVVARGADLIADRDIYGELAHPARLRNWKKIGMFIGSCICVATRSPYLLLIADDNYATGFVC